MEKRIKRLIDANVVIHKINAFAASVVYRGSNLIITGKDTCNPHEYTRGYEQGVLDAQKIVSGQAEVDAVEVVHARKAESAISKTGLMCTACYSDIDRDAVFCKYCGAKMDGERKDNAR